MCKSKGAGLVKRELPYLRPKLVMRVTGGPAACGFGMEPGPCHIHGLVEARVQCSRSRNILSLQDGLLWCGGGCQWFLTFWGRAGLKAIHALWAAHRLLQNRLRCLLSLGPHHCLVNSPSRKSVRIQHPSGGVTDAGRERVGGCLSGPLRRHQGTYC